jgi:hypothetical protein
MVADGCTVPRYYGSKVASYEIVPKSHKVIVQNEPPISEADKSSKYLRAGPLKWRKEFKR